MTNRIFRSSGRGNDFRRLAAAGTIPAFIVSNGSLTLGFQSGSFVPSSSRLMQSPPTGFSIKPASTTTMLYGPLPWDPDCGELLEPFHHETDGLQSPLGNGRYGARIHASPSVAFHRSGLQIGDPEISETVDSYQLTFDLPTEVEQSCFDASVSGNLLTVKVRVTRDTSKGNDIRLLEGWVVKRSSRTDSASRSFLLPDDVSSSSVETAWPSDGKVQVKFIKDITHSNFSDDGSAAVSQRAVMPTTFGSKMRSDKTTPLSVSAQYLSSLSKASSVPLPAAAATKSDAWAPKLEEPTAKAPSPQPHGAASPSSVNSQLPPIRSSLFDTKEQELDEFTKAIEKKFVLRRLPRWEEMAERAAEAAREAKARRVAALRRAMMDVKISESEGGESYLVK